MNRKSILAILTCLMMLSSLAGGLLLIPTQAQLPTPPTITLWGVRTQDPSWGYYGGYWAMWEVIVPELAKIGINVEVVSLDAFDFEAEFYDDWNISGDPNGDGIRDGWDLATREWWLNPTSHIWFDEMVLADHVPEWNISPMMNEKADEYYLTALSAFDPDTLQPDPETYKRSMSYWQKEFKHDPVFAAIYSAKLMSGQAAYFDGYASLGWYYGIREMRLNRTIWDNLVDLGKIPSARIAQGPDALIFGHAEPIGIWHPFYTDYYTEEEVNVITMEMLYRTEVEHMNFPASADSKARIYPSLAEDYPTWYEASEIYPADYPEAEYPDYMVMRVPLRQGVYWSDGVEFNATDVVFTFNSLFDPNAGASARSNYIHIIAEVRANSTHTVDFVTYGPRYELEDLFAMGWGLSMLPYHQYVKWGIADDPGSWETHTSNFDPIPESMGGTGLERLGPYIPVYSDLPTNPTVVEFERFDVYVGPDGSRLDGYPPTPWFYNNTIIDYDLTTPEPDGIGDNAGKQFGWGLPKKLLIKIIPDSTDRFLALQALEVDHIDYPLASVDEWLALDPVKYKVFPEGTPYPAVNPLWFNLNNPILSNRYVRLAICYAIPYQTIYEQVLPGWGVKTAIPVTTYMHPWMEAFDPTIPPFYYDIELAKKYMWMFWNSLDETTWSKYTADPYAAVAANGPVGDHDLSGYVELDDFHVWVQRLGTTPSNYHQYTYPFPATFPEIIDPHVYWPDNDIDPDNDNNDFVEVPDFFDWRDNTGASYP